ncbi:MULTISPECIES: hypothetical protein [unclassified Streptomyces]|uniref:hypothetical protein n=1 Tax=unclassified Streptomyces TaxID=2593676 RepID=UPI002251D96D|nr:hypothetical protein [Streptomyces sp. NBC_01264]MCX4783909.1 hypothetical protein [Streptomyces sp. NBC_01264]
MLAVLDLFLTVLVPLLTGASITYETPKEGLIMRPATRLGAPRMRLRPVRVLMLGVPLVWQPLVGSQLLVERLFGVLVVLGIGMLIGVVVRTVADKVRQRRVC